MRVWLVTIAALLVAGAVLASRLRASDRSPATPDVAVPEGFEVPQPAQRDPGDAAPMRIAGVVVDGEGAPLPSATVKLYARAFTIDDAQCAECGAPAMSCHLPSSTLKLADALKAGAFRAPPVLAETIADAEGRFVFEQAPRGALVWAVAEGHVGAFGAEGEAEQRLELFPVSEVELTLRGDDDLPRTDATVTLFEPVLGGSRQARPDAEGRVTLRTSDPLAWALAEAPGALPWGERVVRDRVVFLGPPRTLIVKTVRDGAPVDADVELEVFRHHFKRRSERGVARFEGLPLLPISLTASAGELVSGHHHVLLEQLETELVVDLFAAGSLTVSLETPDGEPVDEGYVSLSSVVFDDNRDVKPGALVIFERVPAGDYDLVVDSRAFIREERHLEISGGHETRLALTLRKPLILAGSVRDATGAPVEQVQLTITDENGEDVDTRPRAYGADFEEEVPYAGAFIVHAASVALGAAEVRTVVPGPPVTLQLKPRGVIEARVRAPAGEDLSSSVTLVPAEGWRRFSLESPGDGGWARNASLASGEYELRAEPTGYLPLKRTVQITEGKTTRVDLTLDPGVSVSGRLLQHDGKPLKDARVFTNGAAYVGGAVEDDGSFELRGVPPGPLELVACETGSLPVKYFKVEAPARGVELRCSKPQLSHGRVIDAKGAPVRHYRANDREITASDGRFEIPWTGQLNLYAEGFTALSLEDAGVELGDLVLQATPMLEGEVIGADGAPAGGASVRTSNHLAGTRADSRGHFSIEVYKTDEVEVMASLGSLSGTTRGKAGTPVRIVLQPNVHVTGHIVDRQGQGVIATIFAEGNSGRVEFRSDAQGNFSGELAAGVWIFSSRLLDGIRAVDIVGPSAHVELGRSSSACGITVQAPGRKVSVAWLLPAKPASLDVEPEPVANAMSAVGRDDSVVFTGVPCGAYSVVVAFAKPSVHPGSFAFLDSLKPGYASELITLRGNEERLVLPAP